MTNIKNRRKRIKHMKENRKFAKNPLLRSLQVSGPTFRVLGLGSRVPPMRWTLGRGSRVPPTVPGLGSHFSDMPSRLTIFGKK